MLTKLEVTNPRSMTLALEMFENESGLQIAEVDGLDPVKATIVSTSFAGLDGTEFQSARREARNIKIKLDLQPDFDTDTFGSLRKMLYKYFLPKTKIKLRFYEDSGLYVDIQGVVEDHSTPLFAEDPEVDISIMCFQPDLVNPRMFSVAGFTTSTTTPYDIEYGGDIEAGTVLTLNVNRTLASFSMYNLPEDGILQQLDFNGSLVAGDELVISSLKGAKGITLTRGGISSSYLYGRPSSSGWIEMKEGVNQFRVYALGAAIPYTLEYLERYGGL